MRLDTLTLYALALVVGIAGAALAQDDSGSEVDRYFHADEINAGLPPLDDTPNLETPQACLEFFLDRGADSDFTAASHALNLRLLGNVSSTTAAQAAERLFFVVQREVWIDWDLIPDRPDGADDGAGRSAGDSMVGVPRRSIELDSIDVDGRSYPIRLQRLKTPDAEPVWLFSAQTVENIDRLYERHGPGWLEQRLPDWASGVGWGGIAAWKWIGIGVSLALAPAAGWLVSLILRRVVRRVLPITTGFIRDFQWPIAVATTFCILWVILEFGLSLPGPIAAIADPIALALFIGATAWLIMRILNVVMQQFTARTIGRAFEEDSAEHRRVLTQITVARHVLMLVVAFVALGFILLQLDAFRTVGVALLSSAGAAAVILGLAGHAVIGNLIAGLQIALTQPFTIGDIVLVEDRWGKIENITYTYVVVHTWDRRRLVLPVSYFVNHWFENWTRDDPSMVRAVNLHADYRVDVEAVREKFFEVLEADESWDGDRDDSYAIVTDSDEDAITIRLTCTAATPSESWRFHGRVREAMVAWLRDHDGGRYLPRQRLAFERERVTEAV